MQHHPLLIENSEDKHSSLFRRGGVGVGVGAEEKMKFLRPRHLVDLLDVAAVDVVHELLVVRLRVDRLQLFLVHLPTVKLYLSVTEAPAMTVSITTHRMTTLSITTLRMTTLRMTTFSITTLSMMAYSRDSAK
jgi:hypothetical protein